MAFLNSNNGRIFYELEGEASKDVLVFSNSLGTDHTLWNLQLPEVMKHFRVLRYDVRGHGQSETTPGPYSIELLAKDVLALLDELQLEKANFCGISIGGLTGQWLGIHAPERINKLIIANTAAKIGTPEGWNERIDAVRKNGLASIEEATCQRWFTPEFVAANPELVEEVLRVFVQTDPEGYCSCCAAVRDADFRKDISRIKAPTLVIAGTEDSVCTVQDGGLLAENIPDARQVNLKAAHISNIEAAADFSLLLINFCSS